MSRPNQLDLHPDAESLNAFVEHALPDGERDQMLSHLAVCSHCRQVVLLAQEAASEQETEKANLIAAQEKPRSSWFTGWRPAWVMATACAAVLALSLPIYFQHEARNQESARRAQSESEAISGAPAPAPTSAQESRARQELAAPPAASSGSWKSANHASASQHGASVAKSARPPERGAARAPKPAPTAPPSAPPPAPPVGSVSEAVMVAPEPIEAPRPALTETIPTQPAPSTNQQALQSRNAGGGSSAGPGSGLGSGTRMRGFVGGARATMAPRAIPNPAPRSAPSASMPARGAISAVAGAARTPNPVNGARLLSPTGVEILVLVPGEHISADSEEALAAARNAMHQPLPGGQNPVFAASAQHHLLAIDAAGALYLSNDAGKTWELQTPQWAGRAVTLRVAPNGSEVEANKQVDSLGTDSAAAPPQASGAAAGQPQAQPVPATRFEIINDSGAAWTSVDGKTWIAK